MWAWGDDISPGYAGLTSPHGDADTLADPDADDRADPDVCWDAVVPIGPDSRAYTSAGVRIYRAPNWSAVAFSCSDYGWVVGYESSEEGGSAGYMMHWNGTMWEEPTEEMFPYLSYYTSPPFHFGCARVFISRCLGSEPRLFKVPIRW